MSGAPASRATTPASPSTTTRSAPAPVARTSSARPTRSPAPTRRSAPTRASSTRPRSAAAATSIEVPAYVSPIAVSTTSPASTSLNLNARDDRRRSSTARSPRGTTPRSPADNPDADLPGHHDHPGAPLRRLRHDRQLHRLPLEGLATAPGPTTPDGVWPIQGGEAAEGTSGLVAAVKAGEGAIGYADESQAGGLGIVAIGVGDEFNKPSAEGAAQVVANSPRAEGRGDNDMAIDVDRTDDRLGRLPAAADVLPDRLPDLRRRQRGRPGQGLPLLRRLRGRPAGRRRAGRLRAARLRPGRRGRRDHRRRSSRAATDLRTP